MQAKKRQNKGFTLFTALVSFVMMAQSFMLINNMFTVESNYLSILSKMDDKTEQENILDLARIDTLHFINLEVRLAVESYFNIEYWHSDPLIFYKEDITKDWNSVVNQITTTYFFGSSQNRSSGPFQQYLANRIESLLSAISGNYKGMYSISIVYSASNTTTLLANAINESFEKTLNRDKRIFRILDCDGSLRGCKDGSFFLLFNFSYIDPSTYEALPRVRVKNNLTGETLEDAILPKTRLSFYVPTRLFLAIAKARGFLLSDFLDNNSITSNFPKKGFFSNVFHNNIEQYKLGFCDPNSCYPRTDPRTPSTSPVYPSPCEQISSQNINITISSPTGDTFQFNSSYDPLNAIPQKQALSQLVSNIACFYEKYYFQEYSINPSGFNFLAREPRYYQNYLPQNSALCSDTNLAVSVVSEARRSKNFIPTTGTVSPPNPTYTFPSFVADIFSNSCNLGVLNNFSSLLGQHIADFVDTNYFEVEELQGITTEGLYCTEVVEIQYAFEFEEKEEIHKVNKKENFAIGIKVIDDYFPFTPYNYPVSLDGSCNVEPLDRTHQGYILSATAWDCYSVGTYCSPQN